MTDTTLSDQLYASYDGWKGWEKPFTCSADMADYFAAELRGRRLSGTDVLEIGYGNGEFLAWARQQGARITGSEITPGAIEAAKAENVPLIPGDFESSQEVVADSYDVIAAFDVFEHLDAITLVAKLRAINTMLRPGGWLILRFPNGQSPFGLGPQNGDATHMLALSRSKIEQYASGTNLETVHYAGTARPKTGPLSKRLIRALRYTGRDIHARVLRFLYATDIEMDPVVCIILQKAV